MVLYSSKSQAETCEKWVAKAVSVQGTVEARRTGDTQWQPVKLNDTYCPGDAIRVGKRSRADIVLVNQPVLHLDQNTVITLGGVKEGRRSLIELAKGAAHFFSRVARGLEVQTAFVNAGVEGTEFYIRVDEEKTELSIFEGKVLASNKEGSLAITGGQSAVAEAGKAPVPRVVVRPRDAVQWALYYPPVVSYRPDEFQGEGWQGLVKKSLESYWKGDLAGAFSGIEGAPSDVRDPRFFIYRASLLLTVGRVDEAGADIDHALSLDPRNSDAFALQSIIALTQNENEKALTLARKAVENGPQSATAKVALSYAQQADFDLQGALASLNDAVKLDPQNPLAWARLAELRLSFGERDEALEAAQKAVALNPDLSRTQTILGFARLTQVKIKQAQEAFAKAITLDNADPLPRLGLGLSKIREGNLHEGGREIEIAASLDPDNSLIRSYLGKAFFEEKRDKQATEELVIAKQLDPKDPTSFFYDAILKQQTNRPVEALDDVQNAIELNDNRAVYRSRLLLDADLAARSAGLARVYSDLGFEQLALNEGWKSENADPADFSGHRFLADSYSALPRHEIARVSELLQSQLLQPLNITPIQPQLAESNQFVISGAGPSSLSFNEFNPLFNRDRVAVQASGIVGNNNTFGEEVSVAGIYNNVSVSGGQFHYKTDGFRENANVKDDITNIFVQAALSPDTSVQAEFRHRDIERGDLVQRFFENPFWSIHSGFLPDFQQEDKTNSVRLGFHHAFTQGSDIIGNFMYQHADHGLNQTLDFPADILAPFPVEEQTSINGSERALGGELQHLFSSQYVKVTSGVGYFSTKSGDLITDNFFDNSVSPPAFLGAGFPPPADHADRNGNVRHTNGYLYSYINYPKNVTFTIGGSVDSFKSDMVTSIQGLPDTNAVIDKNQFNPKFGITWTPVPETMLRAAAFRTMKRLLITDQTIEPTQVAGFNQFFDDFNGTAAWRYGVAVDQKFSRSVYGGAEYSARHLEIPFITDLTTGEMDTADWHEKLTRAYFYWTPQEWLALRAEYQYEKFDRDIRFTFNAEEVRTSRVPLGVNFIHPSGVSVNLQETYYHQEGEFETLEVPTGVLTHGEDRFWIADASVSYRLPKRHGSITVGANNLFDKDFQYYDTSVGSHIQNPTIQPKRFLYARTTLSF
jgi:tetratricopeptide (TPR) repeat protein